MTLQYQSQRYLREFSTFGIGGPVRYFAEVRSVEDMAEGLRFAKEKGLPFLVIGKGSNSLFDDRGFSGVALLNKIDFSEWDGPRVTVGSGYSFSLLGVQSARKGLSGLEFASGIPATVGGAVFMNAGANGGETRECLESVLYLQENGEKREFRREELTFGYRASPFQRMKGAILAASFALSPKEDARQKQLEIVDYRMKTQPLKEKSVGCVFRNPEPKVSAGEIIERCGLKGLFVGGAKVSEVHANFIVNDNGASAQNVWDLVRLIQRRVFEKTALHLEPEIRIVPYD